MGKFIEQLKKWEQENPDVFNYYILSIAVVWFLIGLTIGYFI